MNSEKYTHHNRGHHADREDLAGEHKYGDAGQLILLAIFLTVWILDSFVLKYSTFLVRDIAWYYKIIPGMILLVVSGYMAWAGLRIVFGEIRETPIVITTGVFSVSRHPVYLGCILFYLGLTVLAMSIISAGLCIVIISFYWHISRHEEKLLKKKFGKEYEDYMRKVSMFLPVKVFR